MTERELVAARKERKFWDQILLYSLVVAVALALVLVGVLLWHDREQGNDIDALASEYNRVRTDKTELCDQKTNTNKAVCATEAPPVDEVVPDAEPDPTPTIITQQLPTTIIRQTLSAAEVRAAVERVCGGSCKGEDVTAAMVAEGIEAYCSTGACGQDGKDGADAPPPSDAQVQAGVAAYCAENDCKGAPGPTCPDGYHGEVLSVLTSLTPPQQEEIFACVVDP